MNNLNPILAKPCPDFEGLVAVLKGERCAERVHNIEIQVDEEVLKFISQRFLGKEWTTDRLDDPTSAFRRKADMYYRLGYDGVPEGVWRGAWVNHPSIGLPAASDTAGELSRGTREWAYEGTGLINSVEDFEDFPWEKIHADYRPYEYYETCLPEGMKVFASAHFFEHILEVLLGFEGLFLKLSDEPELVEAVFDRWAKIVMRYYESVVDFDCVGAIWHADDLGFKTGTILSPTHLRRYVIPWLARFCRIAHDHSKLFILHSCGNYYDNNFIEDLIAAGVDVIHSFQDQILSVQDALSLYGDRIGIAGGVDMDHLCRFRQDQLRQYLRNILRNCTSGRFAYGSGNTISNYVPLENYLIMLDEGRSWN